MNEFVSSDGKRYAVSGFAIDPETHSVGIPAHYRSGLASRLFGAGIAKVAVLGEQVLSERVLSSPSDSGAITQSLEKLGRESSSQATRDFSNEATKDLRETSAELSLEAGTPVTIRLKLSDGGSGVWQ
jgi:hypothetical protein